MSAKDSKAKRQSGKLSVKSTTTSRSCDMSRDESFSLERLQTFSAADFEEYQDRGEEFRLRMSNAVLKSLELPDNWRADCETRNEWGGVFPVHLRLTHTEHDGLNIDILSPGTHSPFWHGLIWVSTGHTGLYFWNAEMLEQGEIKSLLEHADDMVRQGVKRPWDIAAVLRREGKL